MCRSVLSDVSIFRNDNIVSIYGLECKYGYGGAQVAGYDDENFVEYAGCLQADRLRGVGDVHHIEEVCRRGVPCNIWGTID